MSGENVSPPLWKSDKGRLMLSIGTPSVWYIFGKLYSLEKEWRLEKAFMTSLAKMLACCHFGQGWHLYIALLFLFHIAI